jgi:sigma-E factor negative regulatory protein RseA
MSEQFREQLSALMDGELPRDQLRFLLRRADADAELGQCWSRYQLVRSSMRRLPIVPLRADFTEILMQRIAAEALPVAVRRSGALLRWAGGGAIAAAVAVIALVATRPQDINPSLAPAIAATAPAPASVDTHPVTAPLPPLLTNFDYAQPASFDTGPGFETGPIAIPRYDVRRRYEANGVGTVNGVMPYLLLPAPPRTQPAASSHVEEATQP